MCSVMCQLARASPNPSPDPNPNRNPNQEVNGKPVYEKDASTMPMVWASNGYWYVGKRDELGKQAGWMQVRPNLNPNPNPKSNPNSNPNPNPNFN